MVSISAFLWSCASILPLSRSTFLASPCISYKLATGLLVSMVWLKPNCKLLRKNQRDPSWLSTPCTKGGMKGQVSWYSMASGALLPESRGTSPRKRVIWAGKRVVIPLTEKHFRIWSSTNWWVEKPLAYLWEFFLSIFVSINLQTYIF